MDNFEREPEPYLILHKVRGKPAYDIAVRLRCPMCDGSERYLQCAECEWKGYWWIIPTSGHRAYPYHAAPLGQLEAPSMPESIRDHYVVNTPQTPNVPQAKPKGSRSLDEVFAAI